MTLRLVKTEGGDAGTPFECWHCGSKNFVRSGGGWICMTCNQYYAPNLKGSAKSPQLEELKLRLVKLEALRLQLKAMIDQLEESVR